MKLDLEAPDDVREEMRLRRALTLIFHPSDRHPHPPREIPPWTTVTQADGTVGYIDRERERQVIAAHEARRPTFWPVHEPVVTSWGEVFTRTTWWTPTAFGWMQVM